MPNNLVSEAQPSPIQHQHWVEKLADQVLQRTSPPFIVTAGMTTSGPFHMGTLSESLYPASVVRFLEKKGETKFIFSADILDAFDAVPANLAEHTTLLTPHLGKPLCEVPDPLGCCPSFGEHFLNESLSIVEKFGIRPKVRKASDDYRCGAYDNYAKSFIREIDSVRKVIATTSLNDKFPANWHPLMPQCSNCGKIATTEITSSDEEKYSYSCTRKLKYMEGCGFSGSHKLSDHKYKLQWRLHWPSWMDLNGTHIEGGGMDHHTRGGSWDSLLGVFREIFKKEPPIGYKWGFVLFGGKKYSKSKGIGMGVTELLRFVPPQALAYALIRPDLEENRDLSPTGVDLMRLLEDFQNASVLYAKMFSANGEDIMGAVPADSENTSNSKISSESASGPAPSSITSPVSRAERKRALAWNLASSGKTWKAQFSDLLIYHILYSDWDIVSQKMGSEYKEDITFLAPYVENWEKSGMVPSQYTFSFKPIFARSDAAKQFFASLSPSLNALDIHNLAFNTAKSLNAKPGEFFVELYETIIGQPSGPKLGKLIEAIGAEKVKAACLQS